MRRLHLFIVAAPLILLFACSKGRVDSDEIGLSALSQYCQYRELKQDDFAQPRIYSDSKYDVVIEYMTKTNVAPRHVLLVYIKDGRIVEQHSMIEDE